MFGADGGDLFPNAPPVLLVVGGEDIKRNEDRVGAAAQRRDVRLGVFGFREAGCRWSVVVGEVERSAGL